VFHAWDSGRRPGRARVERDAVTPPPGSPVRIVRTPSAVDPRHPHDVPAVEQKRLGWGGWHHEKRVDADTLKRAEEALLRLEGRS
jgi:hypothetical protein